MPGKAKVTISVGGEKINTIPVDMSKYCNGGNVAEVTIKKGWGKENVIFDCAAGGAKSAKITEGEEGDTEKIPADTEKKKKKKKATD